MAKYTNSEHTVISHDGLSIPVDPNNSDYCRLKEQGVVVKPYTAPVTHPLTAWVENMKASDTYMTRVEEDIIEALDNVTKQRLNKEVMDKYNTKKALRASKP